LAKFPLDLSYRYKPYNSPFTTLPELYFK